MSAASSNAERSKSGREPIRTPDLFEEALPRLRDHLGWSQAELGRFFGASKASVCRWEGQGTGETEPRKAVLRALLSALGISSALGIPSALESSSALKGPSALELSEEAFSRLGISSSEGGSRPSEVADRLQEVGAAGMVTAGVHRSSRLSEGGRDAPVDWKSAFRVRSQLGWTQAEFAAFLGVTHSTPAVWESPGGRFDTSVRAALLALGLCSDPDRPEYRQPTSSWEELKTEGLTAFYGEVFELKLGSGQNP